LSGSVALLADLIHNFGDALTAVPLGIAFFLRSARGEKLAGLAVVLAIFVSACVALYETIQRLVHPQHLSHLWALALAGIAGFVGNEIAAQVRLRATSSRWTRGRRARARLRRARAQRHPRGRPWRRPLEPREEMNSLSSPKRPCTPCGAILRPWGRVR